MVLLANGDVRARAALRAANAAGDQLVLPAVVLAEVTRGRTGRDAMVDRAIKAIGVIEGVHEEVARLAGGLLASTGLSATLDSLVLASAVVAREDVILHHDVDDLPVLCAAAGLRSWLVR